MQTHLNSSTMDCSRLRDISNMRILGIPPILVNCSQIFSSSVYLPFSCSSYSSSFYAHSSVLTRWAIANNTDWFGLINGVWDEIQFHRRISDTRAHFVPAGMWRMPKAKSRRIDDTTAEQTVCASQQPGTSTLRTHWSSAVQVELLHCHWLRYGRVEEIL